MKISDNKKGKVLKFKLSEMFDNFAEFQAYANVYELMNSLVYDDMLECWKDNPKVEILLDPKVMILQEVKKKRSTLQEMFREV